MHQVIPYGTSNQHAMRLAPLDRLMAAYRRLEPGMMTASFLFRRACSRVAAALLFAATAVPASAQLIQGLQPRNNLSAYGTLPTNVTPNFGYYGPAVFGYSLGGFLQTPHFVGVEIRGSIQRRLNAQHQESALIGPRVAVRFGRFTPYAVYLIGEGNGWRFRNPPVAGQQQRDIKPVEGMGSQWTFAGGVDLKMSHRVAVRVGEISYSNLHLKNWDLSPVNITAGVVFRLK